MRCVVCDSPSTSLLCSFEPSISTDRCVLEAATRSLVCEACGSVFNAGGARSHELDFYAEHYDLHGESAESEWQVYVKGERQGENDAILEFIEANSQLAEVGSFLEVGCGKGVLLGKFLEAYPKWTAAGVEPSKNAVAYFQRILPEVQIHGGPFETAPFRGQKFDFVASSGVLEHVPDPAAFLSGLRSCLKDGARCYIGIPNFRAKPDDLLLYDHLTQFTPDALDVIYERVGLRRLARSALDSRVWLWDIVEACEPRPPRPEPDLVQRGLDLARSHHQLVDLGRSEFERFLASLGEGDVGAIFGLGVLGLLSWHEAGREEARVRYLLEDNPHLWGQEKSGLVVHGSESVCKLGVNRVFLSANPCYHQRMVDKLVAQGLDAGQVYRWDGV